MKYVIGSLFILLINIVIVFYSPLGFTTSHWADTLDFYSYKTDQLEFLNAKENSHMKDVRSLFLYSIFILIASLVFLYNVEIIWLKAFHLLFAILGICLLWALFDFNTFFYYAHLPFFDGNFAFSPDSAIKRAYPNSFFALYGLCVLLLIALEYGVYRWTLYKS